MRDDPVVLIVDDAPANIQVLAACLKDIGHLKVATDGERCLELAKTHVGIDLILLDIVMPGMDGYEVCRKLKADILTQDIPVIFVTAMDDDDDEEKGLALGAVDYITKPIRPAIVAARVKTHLTLKQQSDQLKDLALRDQLTGLYNRHYLLDAAHSKVARALRHKYAISLLMLDVDHFKRINDQHGHVKGDNVLSAIATVLGQDSRVEDIVSRFGGEEFVIFFDHCDLMSAANKAQRLVDAIAALRPSEIDVTVSIGVAQLQLSGESFTELLSRADAAVYRAKKSGRNRVEVDS
ncbi:diguanylate cyclase response regulator [Gammaproteobacteria bacterium 45_16_T64]|nr:diguanylate cyclase response regulator [Gammaproteobacteria bacterium 45_16_T64]